MATTAPAVLTSLADALTVEGVIDAIVAEVKAFFKLHYANLTGDASVATKLKVVLYDGRVWMIGTSILLLLLAYSGMRKKSLAAKHAQHGTPATQV
jgi:hypothetical protein